MKVLQSSTLRSNTLIRVGFYIFIMLDMRGKLWNIYRVADLNNFNYKKQTTFPRYGRVLSRYLVESFTEAVTLKATFLLKSDYQGIENNDPPIQIKVEDVQFSQPRLVYEGNYFYEPIENLDVDDFFHFHRHFAFSIRLW